MTKPVDEAKLNQFVGQMLGDLGGALSVPLVRIGDRLGLYKALHADGPMTPAELATKTNVAERYAREWLSHQAASGYLTYDSKTGKFTLPPEQAMVLAEPDSPVYLQGGFDIAVTMMENQALLEPAFVRARVSAGASSRSACFAPRDAFSVLAITTASPNPGCRRWMVSSQSSSGARRSRMSVAGTASRRSSWQRRSRTRPSSAMISTWVRWSKPDCTRDNTVSPRTRGSKLLWRASFPATISIS
jgi:hypothetical protein